MGIIVKPSIVVDDIKIEMDKDATSGAETIMSDWGRNIPIIKIGDYVLAIGDVREFSLKVALNSLPSFSMVINDEQYKVRESLKNDIDKCVIFLGYKDWYIKFNGIIDKTFSLLGDSILRLNGTYYNEKLYQGQQFSYKDLSVSDIFKNMCEKTSMGLFTYGDNDLSNVIDYSVMTGHRYIDFMDFLIQTYTNCVYSFDCHSYLHIGNIDTLRKQPLDKYSLNWSTGKSLDSPQDIIFKSFSKTDEKNDFKIPGRLYTINTNFSEIYKETYSNYWLGIGGKGKSEILSNNKIGIGGNNTNTFYGFKNHKFPFYADRINKLIGGNSIKLLTDNIVFELSPLSIVQLEIYLPFTSGRDVKIDEEHSGKKIVIGYNIDFKKQGKDLNKLTQTIELI